MSLLKYIKRRLNYIRYKFRSIAFKGENCNKLKLLQERIKEINDNDKLSTSTWENNRRDIRRAILEDNISDFKDRFTDVKFKFIPIGHIDGHFYLVGTQ